MRAKWPMKPRFSTDTLEQPGSDTSSVEIDKEAADILTFDAD